MHAHSLYWLYSCIQSKDLTVMELNTLAWTDSKVSGANLNSEKTPKIGTPLYNEKICYNIAMFTTLFEMVILTGDDVYKY